MSQKQLELGMQYTEMDPTLAAVYGAGPLVGILLQLHHREMFMRPRIDFHVKGRCHNSWTKSVKSPPSGGRWL